jgi:hypothetical protein
MPRVRAEKTFETFYIPRMLTAGSRTVVKIETVSSVSAAMRRTMTSMTPTMTNPPDVVLQLEAVMQEGSSRSPVI